MKRRTTLAAGIVAAALVGSAGLASAGHLNPLLETDLAGRNEVGAGKGVVGDPNGRGEGYVFGIDADFFDADGDTVQDPGEVTTNTGTLCYVLIVVFARRSPAAFAGAILPAQVVAASTQSSLASPPAMLESARERLGEEREHVPPPGMEQHRLGPVDQEGVEGEALRRPDLGHEHAEPVDAVVDLGDGRGHDGIPCGFRAV